MTATYKITLYHFDLATTKHINPLGKRYCDRAEAYARKALGDDAIETALADGRKLTLDEALDLALKTVEEIE